MKVKRTEILYICECLCVCLARLFGEFIHQLKRKRMCIKEIRGRNEMKKQKNNNKIPTDMTSRV